MLKIIFLVLVLTQFLYGNTHYTVGSEVSFSEDKEVIYKIVKYPPYSIFLYDEIQARDFSFVPQVPGVYHISVDRGHERIIKEVIVQSKEEYKEKEIYDIIEGAIADSDFSKLELMLEKLYSMNPSDKNIREYIISYIDYLIVNEKRREAYELYIILNNTYKLSKRENLIVLERLYKENRSEAKDSLDLEILRALSRYEDRYMIELTKATIHLGKDREASLAYLKNHYKQNMDKEIGSFIANYYLEIDEFEKSEMYLRNSDRARVVKEYIKRGHLEASNLLYSNILNAEERMVVDTFRNQQDNRRRTVEYYNLALSNLENRRYQLAELYFRRVIDESLDKELVGRAIYSLAKMYLDDRRFEDSLRLFERYTLEYGDIRKVEGIYSMGIIYYNLKNYEKSDRIFNQIIEFYPRTIWSTRASIYKLQIENKGDNNES